jgi:hypothetical protein
MSAPEANEVIDDPRAACRGADPDLFISPGDDDDEPDYPDDRAAAYCARCSIRPECLAVALANPDRVGIWGGTSTYQRNQMRREMSRRRCPGCGSLDLTYRQLSQGGIEVCVSCGSSWYVADDKEL